MNLQLELIENIDKALNEACKVLVKKEPGLDEDTAFDMLRGSDAFMRQLQRSARNVRKAEEMRKKASKKRKKAPKKRKTKTKARGVNFDIKDPFERYPDHPNHLPGITTRSVYNAQMGQNMTPIIHNLAKRIARDRNLEEPNYGVLERQMKEVDWAYLAYEAEKIGPKPPKSKITQLFEKVFRPIGKLGDKIPIKHLFLVLTVVQVLYLVWATFYQYTEGMGEQASRGVYRAHKYLLGRAYSRYGKKAGL